MRFVPLVVALALVVAVADDALAAEPQAETSVARGQKFVGEPFRIAVRATGFEEEPEPTCTPGTMPAAITSFRFVGVSPQVSTFVQLFNGQRIEERKVQFTFEFEAVAQKAGAATLPAFVVKQGAKEATTKPIVLTFGTIPIDEGMEIALEIPPGPYAPGEHVPVTLIWSFTGETSHVRNVAIRSAFFDAMTFEDVAAGPQDVLVPLATKDGVIRIKGTVEKATVAGKPGVRIRAKRVWRVEKSGTFTFPPISVQMHRVTRWRRTFFGDREAAAARRVRAEGKPLTVVVESLPEAKRPKSFAGAVGRGFSLEASADRTVVRAGDPIRLTLTLRGDGNLDDAGLPPLTDGGGLDPRNFRQSDSEATGQVVEDAKVFEVTVRVEHDGVARIPPIEYGWWNPTARQYETTRSKPIALQVGEAEIVSAKDVVSAGSTSDRPAGTPTAPTPSARQIVSGADLALVEDMDRLRARPRGPLIPLLLYGAGALVLVAAFLGRKRAQVDPAERARRLAATKAVSAIRAAAGMSATEGARHAAATLRALHAAHPDPKRPTDFLDGVLSRLDAIAYRRDAAADRVPDELLLAARTAAEEIGE